MWTESNLSVLYKFVYFDRPTGQPETVTNETWLPLPTPHGKRKVRGKRTLC